MAITTNGGQPTANVTLSSELSAAITDESGSGALVFATSPTLTTPTLGTASATAIELGHATDTTLARSSAGVITVEGVVVDTISAANTLTNKTLTSPIISSISNTGTLTLPTSTDTLVGKATTDTLTNKTISGASNTLTVRLDNTDVTGTLVTTKGGTGLAT